MVCLHTPQRMRNVVVIFDALFTCRLVTMTDHVHAQRHPITGTGNGLTMWPWTHAAVGYLCYSIATRLTGRRPTGGQTAIVLFGALVPDLIDKPLSWVFSVFPQGYAVGHAVVLAAPLGIAVLAAGNHYGYRSLAIAFVVGNWSHLLGDLLFGWLRSSPYALDRVLWPLVSLPPYDRPVFVRLEEYVSVFTGFQTTGEALIVIVGAVIVYATLGLWVLDGRPGIGPLKRIVEPSYEEYTDRSE